MATAPPDGPTSPTQTYDEYPEGQDVDNAWSYLTGIMSNNLVNYDQSLTALSTRGF